MTTAVIIQARMNSTRLPGKVLEELAGRTVLSHVIERCQAIGSADVICCAVPEGGDSDGVAAEAGRSGAIVFRGSENDVLDRYFQAAVSLGADIILRVTSDCPMIDPEIAGQVIELLGDRGADFATNNLPPSWPHGLDCEAMTFKWLERAWKEAVEPMDREHVSPFIRRHPDARIVNLESPGDSLTNHRWTLDYPEDLEFLRALISLLPPAPAVPGLADILAVLKERPEITAINQMHKIAHYDLETIPAHDRTSATSGNPLE